MALCTWTLIRAGWPDRTRRRFADGLAIVDRCAVLPHFGSFGHRWVPSAMEGAPDAPITLIGIDERSAALWEDGSWTATGAGSIAVIDRAGTRTFQADERIDGLPDPTARA